MWLPFSYGTNTCNSESWCFVMSIIIHPSIETSVFESRTIHVQLPPTHASHQGKSFNAILRGVSLVRGLNYYIPTCIPFVLSPRFGFLVRDSVTFLAECCICASVLQKAAVVGGKNPTKSKMWQNSNTYDAHLTKKPERGSLLAYDYRSFHNH